MPRPSVRVEGLVARLFSDAVLVTLATLVILMLAIAATLRRPHMGVDLYAIATSIRFQSANELNVDLSIDLGSNGSVIADEFSSLSLNSACDIPTNRGLRMDGKLQLSGLRTSANSLVSISVNAEQHQLVILLYGDASADIEAGVNARFTDLSGLPIECAPPQTAAQVQLDHARSATPARIRMSAPRIANAEILPAVPISYLNLNLPDEANSGGSTLRSGIVKGSLRLLDIDKSLTLREGEPLTFDRPSAILGPVWLDKGQMRFLMNGEAVKIFAGPTPFARDLSPTWLEWFAATYKEAGIWSLAASILTGLWSVRAWVKKQPPAYDRP